MCISHDKKIEIQQTDSVAAAAGGLETETHLVVTVSLQRTQLPAINNIFHQLHLIQYISTQVSDVSRNVSK